MRLGFTGTRMGLTEAQYITVTGLVNELRPEFAIHGDCIGADSDFNKIVIFARGGIDAERPPKLIHYPSTSKSTRAKNLGACVIHMPSPPLIRDVDIVTECDALIACPHKSTLESQKGGTWYTYKLAKKYNKPTYLVYPDGRII